MDEKQFDFSENSEKQEEKIEDNVLNQNDLNTEQNATEKEISQSNDAETNQTTSQAEVSTNENESTDDKNIEQNDVADQVDSTTDEQKADTEVENIETVAEVKTEAKEEEKADEHKEHIKRIKSARQKHYDEVFSELKEKMATDEVIEVEIISRIRGGLRVHYKDVALFLPTSHFTLKRNPSEEEMKEAIGTKIKVNVHEYQEFDEDRKAVIVSRKKILLNEVWDKINVGDVIEGKISSIATFGVFVEFMGIEGLIHISRLSRAHIDNPNKYFKKGEPIQAKIIEIHKDKNKIALSRKELEESPWKGISEEFKAGDQVKGIVRRLTEFGAYVELKPGVDGLLRNNEIHWTKRIKRPSEVLKPGQEIMVQIMNLSEEKHNAALSLKRTQVNPWPELAEKFKIGTEFEGEILQVIPQGAIVNIDEDVDGFMPRSKMRNVMKGKKIPYKSGDKVQVVVTDLNPNEESLILSPKVDKELKIDNPTLNKRKQNDKKRAVSLNSSFSLGDMLTENQKEQLKNLGQ